MSAIITNKYIIKKFELGDYSTYYIECFIRHFRKGYDEGQFQAKKEIEQTIKNMNHEQIFSDQELKERAIEIAKFSKSTEIFLKSNGIITSIS